MQDLVREQNKRDIKFWTNLSDLDGEVLSMMFRFNYSKRDIKKQIARLMEDERQISEIIL